MSLADCFINTRKEGEEVTLEEIMKLSQEAISGMYWQRAWNKKIMQINIQNSDDVKSTRNNSTEVITMTEVNTQADAL